MKDAAIEYLEQGLSVIPIRPGTKKPYCAWGDYQERLPLEEEVETLQNDALNDSKPINTIIATGSRRESSFIGELADTSEWIDNLRGDASGSTSTSEYPYIKLRYNPLYKRMNNREYGPTNVQFDTTSVSATKTKAKNEFKAHVSGGTEGRIIIRGNPFVDAGDTIKTLPACGGTLNQDVRPITYGINEVEHVAQVGKPYKTKIRVEPRIDPNGFEFIVDEYRQAK